MNQFNQSVSEEVVWAFDLARSVLGKDLTIDGLVAVASIAMQRADIAYEKHHISGLTESDLEVNPYSRGGKPNG